MTNIAEIAPTNILTNNKDRLIIDSIHPSFFENMNLIQFIKKYNLNQKAISDAVEIDYKRLRNCVGKPDKYRLHDEEKEAILSYLSKYVLDMTKDLLEGIK